MTLRDWWGRLRLVERIAPWWDEAAELIADETAQRNHLSAIADRIRGERVRQQSRARIEAVARRKP